MSEPAENERLFDLIRDALTSEELAVLMGKAGGTVIWVPSVKSCTPEFPLCQLVGETITKKMARAFQIDRMGDYVGVLAGGRIYIPLAVSRDARLREAIRSMLDAGRTPVEIARTLGCSERTVYRVRRPKKATTARSIRTIYASTQSRSVQEKITALFEKGVSPNQISDKLGLSSAAVHSFIGQIKKKTAEKALTKCQD